MSAPKSVVKIKKNGVEYTSNVDAAQYYLFELTRAALRDVGRFVCRKFREEYYKNFKRRTGDGGKACKYVVYSNKKTTHPRVDIGLKTGKVPGFYAFYQEFGSSRHKKLGLLQKIVESNVAQIVEIESKYLSALEDEAAALRMIESEGDYDGGADK